MKAPFPRAILQGAAYLIDLGGTLSRRGTRDPYEGAARAMNDAWRVLDGALPLTIEDDSVSSTHY